MSTESTAAVFAAIVQRPAPLPADLVAPDPSVRLDAGLEALSPNTRRVYGAALRTWGLWCAVHGVDPLAAPPADFRVFLLERAADGVGVSSLRLSVAALRKLQALAGVAPTSGDQVVVDTVRGLVKRAGGAVPRQAAALTANVLAAISATALRPRRGRGGHKEPRASARKRGRLDMAICYVMSDAGLRRSEAAALVWDDLEIWEDGTGRLTVRRSKTDTGARTIYLTRVAVKALITIRPAGVRGSSSIFGLSASTIARRIKAAAAAAALGTGFSGHSGRVGMARRMAKAGAPTHEIMAQGRWKTAGMVEVYTRAEEAGRAGKWLS